MQPQVLLICYSSETKTVCCLLSSAVMKTGDVTGNEYYVVTVNGVKHFLWKHKKLSRHNKRLSRRVSQLGGRSSRLVDASRFDFDPSGFSSGQARANLF